MGAPWQLLKERMEAIGYHVTFVDLSPCHIGVPQTRSRLYMVLALSSPYDVINGIQDLKIYSHADSLSSLSCPSFLAHQ
jgi:site-specific DNA-cytosine methylase